VIIDAHCHAGRGDILTAPWNSNAPLDKYLRRARRARIDRTVLVPAFHSDYSVANAALGRIVARDPERLMGFAFVHPKRDAGRIFAMISHAVRRWNFRGIKVHGMDGMPTREICEVAQRFAIPILVDVVGRAHVIDMFAEEYPQVDFIIPHLGTFADDWRVYRQVIDRMSRYPNVYADTSGVRQFDLLLEAVQRAGASKVIFGSDGPWLHPGLELYKVRLMGLPASDEHLVLAGNILRLMRKRKKMEDRTLAASEMSWQRQLRAGG
jgi:predicted TIM-barrel fold metal-dependent hydrolase